jgi:glycosidase
MPLAIEKLRNELGFAVWNSGTYRIPAAWKDRPESEGIVAVNPVEWLIERLDLILAAKPPLPVEGISLSKIRRLESRNGKFAVGTSGAGTTAWRHPGDWLAGSQIYGMYIRNFTAFDHDGDGVLGGSPADITRNPQGARETGTFLKAIALLPYVRDLGFDTIYLLPVSLTGDSHRKGELGSPYSIRDPMKIDPILADPLVSAFSPEEQFRAFVEAAHLLGLRVILDFAFRTAARDSDWIAEHPDWFYWIDSSAAAAFRAPAFSPDEIREIKAREKSKNFDTIAPPREYRSLFREPPAAALLKRSDAGGYEAETPAGRVVVPGAFADWPPDDKQPPWDDVSYLRLYGDAEFNYVAYNTVRVYDHRIRKENKALWDRLASIIPFYQKEFGIDGARIDMAHALPKKLEKLIIQEVRRVDPDFGFVSEDFSPQSHARESGYNIVNGDAVYNLHRVGVMNEARKSMGKTWIHALPHNRTPVLGAPETADSPRAVSRRGGVKFSELAWMLVNTLPNVVPFCMAGFEMGDRQPTNLGVDFSPEEIESYRDTPLAFFRRASLHWDSPFRTELVPTVREINRIRRENLGVFSHIDNFRWLETVVDGEASLSEKNPVVAYMRVYGEEIVSVLTAGIFGEVIYPIEVEHDYLVVVNTNGNSERIATVKIGEDTEFVDVRNGTEYRTVDGELNMRLKPGEAVLAKSL